jgi:hypothetical protein
VAAFVGFDDPAGNHVELVVDQAVLGRRVEFAREAGIIEFGHLCLDAPSPQEAAQFWTTVFSARVGLHGVVGPSMGAAIWTGAMHQKIQQRVAGSVANTDLQFIVVQSPKAPWNALLGGLLEFGKDGYVLLEGGIGERKSILASAVYRF